MSFRWLLVGRITTAMAAVTPGMLTKLWDEFDNCLDICQVSGGLQSCFVCKLLKTLTSSFFVQSFEIWWLFLTHSVAYGWTSIMDKQNSPIKFLQLCLHLQVISGVIGVLCHYDNKHTDSQCVTCIILTQEVGDWVVSDLDVPITLVEIPACVNRGATFCS